MKRTIWLIPLAFAAACSSRDQTLGETHPTPQPVIVDPNPNPSPNPNPNPSPDPMPTTPPCEDVSRHGRRGACMPPSECRGTLITGAGYECNGADVCCDYSVGACHPMPCGGAGSAMPQGGDGGNSSAGAGGSP